MQVHLNFNFLETQLIKDALRELLVQKPETAIFVNGVLNYIDEKISEAQELGSQNNIYLIQHEETNRIYYCGHDLKAANSFLENPHLSKTEAAKYYMTIYDSEGTVLNTDINKKIEL